jgi:hypothetical protein
LARCPAGERLPQTDPCLDDRHDQCPSSPPRGLRVAA